MRFDCRAVLADSVGNSLVLLHATDFDRSTFFLVLFDHPLVLLSRRRGLALWQQEVAGVARLYLYYFATLAEFINIVDKEHFHVA